jgi:hypothetical protein
MEAEIAPDPIHYRDGEGRWQEIDTRVAATADREGFGFGNTRNGFGSFFGTRSDRLVRFEVGQRHLVVGVAGAARGLSPRVEGDTVAYRDVFGTADLVYQLTGEGLKEEIVLEEASDDPTFSFVVQMDGVTARGLDDGSIGFFWTGGGGPPLFALPKPFMFDDADDAGSPYGKAWSNAGTQTVEQQGSRIEITPVRRRTSGGVIKCCCRSGTCVT